MGTGRGANETDFTCVCGAAEVVERDSGATSGAAEEVKPREEVGSDVVMTVDAAVLATVSDRPAVVMEGSDVFVMDVAEGRVGRLPDRLDDSLVPELVGRAFDLISVVVAASVFGGGLSSAVRISLNLAVAASRSFFRSSWVTEWVVDRGVGWRERERER